MNKTVLSIAALVIVVVAALLLLLLPGEEEVQASELVVYAYDSFTSEWGPGPKVAEAFEEEYGIPVRYVSVGDAGQVLQRAISEKENPQADILIGIDNNLLHRAKQAGVFSPYESEKLSQVPQELRFDPEHHVTPFDYGFFSIIYDSQRIDDPPASLEDLTDERFKEDLILMDPRTSSPGLGFLLWTVERYGEGFTEYWQRLEDSLLTVTEGWDAGYGLFTSGEAPLVLSYTTSPAYHAEFEDSTRYKAAIFDEGHYQQIEGLGVVDGAPHPEAARRFVDFALSETFQSIIPLTNWMYPVRRDIELPDSYRHAPQPPQALELPAEEIAGQRSGWIEAWTRIVTTD
jgi:thiamine transport system substrate-binding protein